MNAAATGGGGSPQDLLDGFRPAILVSLAAAVIGVGATTVRPRVAPAPAPESA